jgi:hypothetical protein
VSRRELLRTGTAIAAGAVAGPALARGQLEALAMFQGPAQSPTQRAATVHATPVSPVTIRPDLFRRALAALQRHQGQVMLRDRIALVDFDRPSSQPRFHVVDLASGRSRSLLVSHGRGSDPEHSGWLTRFSNDPGSAASSSGAFVTGDIYVGQHGRSRRLVGLDRTNDNAEPRAIVVHSAWYVSPEMVAQHGKLGRSEGCFAVSTAELEYTLQTLGAGRMIYADKV